MGAQNLSGDDEYTTLSEINVTPFVDVMLVLLVIFMATAPALTRGVRVRLPRAEAASMPSLEESVILTVDKEGGIFIDENRLSLEKLRVKLAYIFEGRPEAKREVFIRADREVAYGKVLAVMATVKAAGIDKVGMVTEPASAPNEGKEKKGRGAGK